jgi:hypothetical protein
MSKFVNFTPRSLRTAVVRIPIVSALIIAAVVSLWFVTARPALALNVQVCHKRVDTITVVFGSLDYRRHKDHGDTDGPCAATTSRAFLKPAHGPAKKTPNQ